MPKKKGLLALVVESGIGSVGARRWSRIHQEIKVQSRSEISGCCCVSCIFKAQRLPGGVLAVVANSSETKIAGE